MRAQSVILFTLIFLGNILVAFAQDEEAKDPCAKTENQKALKLLTKAKKEEDFEKCKEIVADAVEEEPGFTEAYMFLAKRAKRKEDFKTAIEAYKKVIELCPDYSEAPYFDLGTYFYYKEEYDSALKYLAGYVRSEKAKGEQLDYADSLMHRAKLLMKKVPFKPVKVLGVSSDSAEYLPIISPDNELAFYTRRYDKNKRGDYKPVSVEEFTVSHRQPDGSFDKGELMPPPFNQNNNEGGATVSVDNKYLYFTICKQDGKYVNCDIYFSVFDGERWSEIKNLGPEVNGPRSWDSQPSVSPDGNTIYFGSDRDSTRGSDIYKTVRNASGKWGAPVRLNNNINTKGSEKSPFIHPDNRTLYFTSDGHPGIGGFDIFFSKLDSTGDWGPARNIGYPINSEFDDLGFFVSTDGKTGYFASNKLQGGKGGWDVYGFDLYEGARPEKVLFVKGELKKDKSDTTAIRANVTLKDTKTNVETKVNVDSVTGKYVGVVNFQNDMIMTVKREGYAFTSQYFAKQDSTYEKPITVDLPIRKIEVGGTYQLNNIYFETNSADLKEESIRVLDEFTGFLKENMVMTVEIQGHTDNVGNDQKNFVLSTDRAFTVFDYLRQHGVAPGRLSYKGFGKTKPVASNETEEGRAKNRRTEFLITGL